MLFLPTDKSRAFGNQMLTNAALSGLFYGPFSLAVLLFFARGRLGNTPLLPYAYAFDFALVLFLYYYNNIVRRGRLFSRIIDTVWVSEGQLFYRTNPWLFTKSTEGVCAIQGLRLTRKSIMSVNLIELSSGQGVSREYGLYLMENSLVNEQALLDMIEQWPKDR